MSPGFRRSAALAAFAAFTTVFTFCDDPVPPNERVSSLTASSGDLQGGIVGMQLGQPIVVLAVDGQDRPVGGATVEWTVTSGGGTITPVDARTDANGTASATWVLGEDAGEQTATAMVGTVSHTFRATALAGSAESVTLTPAAVAIDAIEGTAALDASATDEFGNPITGRAFTWTSQNSNVAVVSSSGVVTARGNGSTQIQASLDGATGSADVTVSQVATQVGISPASGSLTAVGQTLQLTASAQDRNGNPINRPQTDYTWTSSNIGVATVSSSGLVTAAGGGTAQITAAMGSASASVAVTVTQTASMVTVSPKVDTLTTAQPNRQLVVDARDSNNQVILNPSLTWLSRDTLIARVSATGLVTAVSNGSTIVKVTSGMVMDSATIVVRLNAPPKAVNDAFGAITNTQLLVNAPGVLGNDTLGIPVATVVSFGGGSLGGTVTSNTAGGVAAGVDGSVQVFANGAIAFTPTMNFNGVFTFMYRIQTTAGMSDATVTIQVGNPPMASDDAYMTTVNVPITVGPPGVLGNDNLGFPVATVSRFGGGNLSGSVTDFAAGQLVVFGIGGFSGGQIRIQADGSLSFTPPTNYVGTYTVMYRMASTTGTSDATITFTVGPVPQPEQ